MLVTDALTLYPTAIEDDALASLLEPAEMGVKAFHSVSVRPKDRVLILGSGPIGLCLLLAARARMETEILVSEPSPIRREIATRLGAEVIDPNRDDPRAVIADRTDGAGVDVTFECAGNQQSLDTAVDVTRRGGTMALVALYRRTPRLDPMRVLMRELRLAGVFGPHPLDGGRNSHAPEAASLITSHPDDYRTIITHRMPLDRAAEAFNLAGDPQQCCKVLLEP